MMDDTPKRPNIATYKSLKDCKTLQDAFDNKEFHELVGRATPASLGIKPTQMIRTFINAANRSPNIYKCDFREALGKFMTVAYLGLRPGPELGLVHLIPFERTKYNRQTKKREPDGYDLQMVIGYPGCVELAFRSGFVKDIATGVVYPGDIFDFERGSERFLRHKPSLETNNDAVTPRASWAMFKLANGGEEFDVMSWAEIERIRNQSQAYRRALAAKNSAQENGRSVPITWTEAPWVRYAPEMGRKTVLKRASKIVPRCPELHFANAFEDAQDRGASFDFGPIIEGEANPIEDGIGERDPNAEPDAGGTFTDRRTPTAEATRAESPEPKQEQKESDSAREAGFGPAIILDCDGEPEQDDQEYTDPQIYARRIVTLWTGYSDADRLAFREYNESWIEEARVYAGDILKQLDQETEQPVAAVEVIVARGQPSYGGYLKDLEAAGAATPSHMVERWIEVQRDVVTGLPFAQRTQAIKRLTATAARAKLALPRWAADALIREATPGGGGPETTGKPLDPDQAWVDRQIEELGKIEQIQPQDAARRAYNEAFAAAAVQQKLAAMKERNPMQHGRLAVVADKVFRAINAEQKQ